MIAGAIPLIDVSGHLAGDAEASRRAAAQLRWAFENVGFYYLSGHGVAQSLIDRTYEAAARFHAQPMSSKLALKVNEHNIGYLPISDATSPQAAAQGRKPSQNEAYFLRRERAPDDPAVIANKRFHGLNSGPPICRGFARRRSNTCARWRRCAAGWCRSTPWRSICRPISSTHVSPSRT
jgi:isopenicillin N synthase-like dioxygenase